MLVTVSMETFRKSRTDNAQTTNILAGYAAAGICNASATCLEPAGLFLLKPLCTTSAYKHAYLLAPRDAEKSSLLNMAIEPVTIALALLRACSKPASWHCVDFSDPLCYQVSG